MFPVRLIVFDWDGTLMDSEARIVASMQAAFGQSGLSPPEPENIRQIIGLGLAEGLHALLPNLDRGTGELLAARYRYHFLADQAVPSPLYEGVPKTLSDLRARGYLLAIATGKSRAGLDRTLLACGLGDWLDDSCCADESRSKPHPLMLETIMDRLGVPATSTLMVGDTTFDLEMARHAGTYSIAVSYGAHPRQRLMAYNPLTCLDDIKHLPPWLKQHGIPPRLHDMGTP